jgi:hypothetical protein
MSTFYEIDSAKPAQRSVFSRVRARALKSTENAKRYDQGLTHKEGHAVPKNDLLRAIELIADGKSHSRAAREINISNMQLQAALVTDFGRQYMDAAKRARASLHADAVIEVAAAAERGEIDHRAAKHSIAAHTWHAERWSPDDWGAKRQVDVNMHVDIAQQLDAASARVRRLAMQSPVIEGEFSVVNQAVSLEDLF